MLISRILFYVLHWNIYLINIGELLSLFFYFLVLSVSFVGLCLASFWEYRLDQGFSNFVVATHFEKAFFMRPP